MRDFYQVRTALDRAQRDRKHLEDDANAIRARIRGGEDSDGLRERLGNLTRGLEQRDIEVAELEAEAGQALAEGVRTGRFQTEAGTAFDAPTRADEPSGNRQARRRRDAAMRTIERHVNQGDLTAEAAERVDGVLSGPDADLGVDAAYIEAAGSPAYARAFHKLIRYGDGAVLRMTGEEQQAVQSVNHAEQTRAALAVGTGSTGGFAIPIAIDPTINLSSNGRSTRSASSPTSGPCRRGNCGY